MDVVASVYPVYGVHQFNLTLHWDSVCLAATIINNTVFAVDSREFLAKYIARIIQISMKNVEQICVRIGYFVVKDKKIYDLLRSIQCNHWFSTQTRTPISNSIQGKLFGTLIFQHLICFDSMHQTERNYGKKYWVEKEEKKKTNRN